MTGNQPVHLDTSDCHQFNTSIYYIHPSGKVLPYSLLTTVRCSSLVLATWTRAYSSYFTSTTIISLPSPKLAGGRRNDVLGQERHSGGSDRDWEFLPTGIWEFSCHVGLLHQADHSPAGTVGSAGKHQFLRRFLPWLFSVGSHLRLACERFRSPSRVGLKMAVPIFMLALRLTNHSVLLANPTKCHFPAIFLKESRKQRIFNFWDAPAQTFHILFLKVSICMCSKCINIK